MARDLPALDQLQAAVGTQDGKRQLAAALAALEATPEAPEAIGLLSAAYDDDSALNAHVVGLTGPPGVGKSTLAAALVRAWRGSGKTVGMIAVDPSSRSSGGALLGDRTRLELDPEDSGVFVRSMAARDRLGGLAEITYPAMVLMRAVFDVVLVETVGVGQSEAAIANVADSVVLCLQPGSGDSLQYMKAGIVEIPDIMTVNKADLGELAVRTGADVEGALGLASREGDWTPPVLLVSAARGDGLEVLLEALEKHGDWLRETDRLRRRRASQASAWLIEAIRERYGRVGLARAGDIAPQVQESPFHRLGEIVGAEMARG